MTGTADGARWQQLGAMFDTLIELDPVAREARLRDLRAGDPALAAELEAMLAADATGGVLDHTLPTLDGLLPDAGVDRSGERVGPYQLLRLLGRGGMGEVWLGERTGGDFEQRVAIKLLKRGMDSDALLQRFARERRILAQLEHPHIARLLDGGVGADGTPFFAMEYIDGSSITEHARRTGLAPRDRVQLLLQAVDAVAHAQSRLVVHRDLKPSNIMVDVQGRVRVLDFGIAKLLDEAEDERLTGTGVGVLSPAYAAPEQVRGEAVTTATDVYALGGVLFELLTGRAPHPQRGSTPAAWLKAVQEETAERPSAVLRRSGEASVSGEYGASTRERLARELSGDLDTIVLTALHPDPQRRYAGAAQLAQDLRRYLDGRPIAARPDTAGYRMRKFVARHRLGVGSATVAVLALIAGLGIALWQAGVAREQAARADAEAARAQQQAERADQEAARALAQAARTGKVKDFLSSIFLQVDPLRRDAQGERTLAQAFDEALARIDSEFAEDPETRIDLLDDFGEIRAGQGDFGASQALFERALALAEQTHGPDHPAVAESLLNIGVLAGYRGQTNEGEAPLRRAIAILEPHADEEPIKLAAAYTGLANVIHSRGGHRETIPVLERVLELRRKHDAAQPLQIAIALQNIATVLTSVGEHARAKPYVEEAIALVETHAGADSANMIPILWQLDDIQYHEGDLEAEAETIRREVALVRKHIPGDHWWKGRTLAEHGFILAREGDAEAGMAALMEAEAVYRRMDSPQVTDALRRKGQVQLMQGDAAGAVRSYEEVVTVCREKERSNNTTCLSAAANLAEARALAGDHALALQEADAAAAAIVDALGEDSDPHAQAQHARALALEGLGRRDEAQAAHQRRRAILARVYGAGHPSVQRLPAGP